MNRSSMREHVFRMIFSYEFDVKVPVIEHVSDYLDTIELKEQERLYMTNRVVDLLNKKIELDEKISSASNKWQIDRIAKVDLAIVRLCLYEILFDEDIPTPVAVNEAVELARKYGGDASPKFVNGIIGNIINKKA